MKHFLLLACLLCLPWQARAANPTIVVFLSDDHGQLDSTPYGSKDVRTPAMQRLADAGMTFTHAFIVSPACAPSRTAMLTGLMPARNGAENNHTFKRDDVASLPDAMRKLGYQTAAFGKVAHGGRDVQRHGFDVFDERHDAAFVGKFLAERDGSKPLCLFVGTHEPHVPWANLEGYDPARVTLPAKFVDTPETHEHRARYYTDITTADTQLGEMLDLAKRHFDPASTLFIYTSDHGGQWPFGKWNLYDTGIRVPFLAAWPGVIRPGARTGAMVQWIDLWPTLIEAAGGTVPAGIDGRSFLSVLRGEKFAHREVIFATHSGDGAMNVYPIRAVREGDWKLILNLHPEYAHTTHIDKSPKVTSGLAYWQSWFDKAKSDPTAAAVVRRYHERPAVELYNLRADPQEAHNLATDPAQSARVKKMHAQLEDWMKQQGDQQTVFNTPRLLTDPASTQPVAPEAPGAAPIKKGRNPIQPAARTYFTGHSFAGVAWLGILAQQGNIAGFEHLGRQALGGSRVIDHWKLADERNMAKKALLGGKVDILTLSPNMQMPDEGIDLFVDLALQQNPQMRILVQGSWMTWDGLGRNGIVNAGRDARPVSEIRERTERHMAAIRDQLTAINARHGRTVCTLIPVGLGVVRLREWIAEKKLPGFERPSQLFVDDIGHAKAPVLQLLNYMYYSAIFHRDPRELKGLGTNGWGKDLGPMSPELTPLLQSIAWEVMNAEPLSGLPRK